MIISDHDWNLEKKQPKGEISIRLRFNSQPAIRICLAKGVTQTRQIHGLQKTIRTLQERALEAEKHPELSK